MKPDAAQGPRPREGGRRGRRASKSGLGWLVGAIAIIVLAALALQLASNRRLSTARAPAALPSTGRADATNRTAASNSPEGKTAALITQANQILKQGKVAEAAQLYREAVQLAPKDEDARYNLGIALARLGQTNEAIAEYKAALEIFPDYAEVHNNLGNLLLRSGNQDEARQHFLAAIKAMPDYAQAYNNLGNAERLGGHALVALTNYAKAVALNTNYWEARFNLATSYKEQSRLAEAAAEYREVLRQNPGFAPAEQALRAVEQNLPAPLR